LSDENLIVKVGEKMDEKGNKKIKGGHGRITHRPRDVYFSTLSYFIIHI
jgi:hypothetical protein